MHIDDDSRRDDPEIATRGEEVGGQSRIRLKMNLKGHIRPMARSFPAEVLSGDIYLDDCEYNADRNPLKHHATGLLNHRYRWLVKTIPRSWFHGTQHVSSGGTTWSRYQAALGIDEGPKAKVYRYLRLQSSYLA